MTTIPQMLTSRTTDTGRASGAMSFGRPDEDTSEFADVLDQLVDERARPKTEIHERRRDQDQPVDKQETPVRSRDDRADEEGQISSNSQEETDADTPAAEQEDEEGFVPIADTSAVAQPQEAMELTVEETAPAESSTVWQRVQVSDQREAQRLDRTTAPAQAVTTETPDAVIALTGAQAGGQDADSALDLLTAQELMAPEEIQVETEGGELFERLQQAIATGSTLLADDVGEVVVPQVVRNMAALARNGVSEMRVRLQPGDLGEIELRVRAMEGIVRGELIVQHPEVKQLLDSQMERLRTALAQHGLQLEGFDVGVSDHRSEAGGDGDGESSSLPGHAGQGDDEEGADDPATRTLAPLHPVRLDPNANDWLV